jgi:quinol monooxygenase YgiN
MTSVSLYVELYAKPGKEDELASFLASAQSFVAAESATVAWFAVRFDRSTFAIFDAFNDEAGRAAHLGGQVAAALWARADELLATPPQIRNAGVLADKLSGVTCTSEGRRVAAKVLPPRFAWLSRNSRPEHMDNGAGSSSVPIPGAGSSGSW